jgi:hypothetical protein
VEVVTAADTITLRNGLTEVVLPRREGSLIRRLVCQGRTLVAEGQRVDLHALDPHGKIFRASVHGQYTVTVPHANALTATVRLAGKHAAHDGTTLLDFALQFTLTAGCPDLRLDHTFYCREAIDAKLAVGGLRLVIPTTMRPDATKVIRQAHHGHSYQARTVELRENVELVGSAVADIENYRRDYAPYSGRTHGCAGGQVFIRNFGSFREQPGDYPFHMRPGYAGGFRADLTIGGLRRVHPVIGWRQDDCTVVVAFERWAQLHPKSVAIDEGELTIGIWPTWSVPMEVVKGVSKTHTIWLTAAPRALDSIAIEHCLLRWEVNGLDPVDIHFDPAWPAFCQVLDCHRLLRFQPDRYPLLENLIESYPAAGNPHRFTYPRHDASGMFNYGDFGGAGGFTNNEDDVRVLAPLQDYLRTGHTYCFDAAKEAAIHYMEVDFCEWSTDPRQRGGLIPHTVDHFVGNVYPSHQWSEGLLAYYYLTGDERARRAVIGVADNVCYWASVPELLHCICCDGRESGMPLVNLAAAYRLTGDAKYVATAKYIIANFHQKWFDTYGDLRYPYPQSAGPGAHQKVISGYGDWSSYYGLWRLYEVTGDTAVRELLLALLDKAVVPANFGLNDARAMDFFSAWALIQLTGDEAAVLERLRAVVPMLLRRGGHPLRRLHFLEVMDRHQLIDEQQVGNRPGVI